jgi:formylmethanofuran dehydrogenase subunit E
MDGIEEDDDGPIFIVCVPVTTPLHFKDNVIAACQFCQQPVQHRPNVVTPHRIICILCWQDRKEPDDTILITATSIREYLSRFRH